LNIRQKAIPHYGFSLGDGNTGRNPFLYFTLEGFTSQFGKWEDFINRFGVVCGYRISLSPIAKENN